MKQGNPGTVRESPEKWREYMRNYRRNRRKNGCCGHCGQPLPGARRRPRKEDEK